MKHIFFKNKNRSKKSGFTLVEMLVSIAIFGVISILMSNIVISMARFSLLNERRNDILTEIDNAANTIKNDLRSAKEVGICTYNSKKYIYRRDAVDAYFRLDQNTNRLIWLRISTPGDCNGSVVDKELTSPNITTISTLRVAYSIDSLNSGESNLNTLLYVNIDLYDPSPNQPVFDKDKNPYSYYFAISTRKINVL